MCGIVGAVGQRDIVAILLDGLHRLEYRGYDSAGVATISAMNKIKRVRCQGKVKILEQALAEDPVTGNTGIAHTRWATHGRPCKSNAHPHFIGDRIAVVHNGIIENYQEITKELLLEGYDLTSETDTEIVAASIFEQLEHGRANNILQAVQNTVKKLEGAFALGIIDAKDSNRLIAARKGSPLVIGVGIGEYFLGSDALALQKVTQEFIYLEEGDIADIRAEKLQIYNVAGQKVTREIHSRDFQFDAVEKGEYRHFMHKEIFEQPQAIRAILDGRLHNGQVLEEIFGNNGKGIFDKTKHVQIIACGTSYHAGLVAKYWLEELVGVSCSVEIASEFRYRKKVVLADTLLVAISQSGETADTLAALRDTVTESTGLYCGTLGICNVPDSSLVRETDLTLLTHAGPEIGVATTKGFTTQLVGLLMLSLCLGKRRQMTAETAVEIVEALEQLPDVFEQFLRLETVIKDLACSFMEKHHTLFLGRGVQYPIAMEGALKLKELSYIHAEAYPAGELKHGPLALVDSDMPVVVLAPDDHLLSKLKASIQEVHARGGKLFVICSQNINKANKMPGLNMLIVPNVPNVVAPIAYSVVLQLLSYHVAVLKGTDVDQPRNLAKSVTVE